MGVRTVVGQEAQALWGDGKGVSLTAVATGWALLIGVRMIYPVIIPFLQTTYGLSLTAAGLLISVLGLFASIGQLPAGVLADRHDERTIMMGSVFIVAVALGAVVTAPTPLVLFLATALWGLGYSLYPVARVTFLSELYPDRLGSALGVTLATSDVSQAVLPPVASVLAVAIAWQVGLGFVAPLLVLAGIAIYLTGHGEATAEQSVETRSVRETLARLTEFHTPEMRNATVVLFLYLFIWHSFTAFFPTYLTSVKAMAPATASLLFGFFFAVGILIKPTAGAVYDRVGIRRTLVAILLPPVAGFLLLPFVDGLWSLVVLTALVSTMLGSGAVTQSYITDSLPQSVQGTGLGAIKTVTSTLAAGGPVLFGVVADYGYFDAGYLFLAVVMAAGVLLALRMPRP